MGQCLGLCRKPQQQQPPEPATRKPSLPRYETQGGYASYSSGEDADDDDSSVSSFDSADSDYQMAIEVLADLHDYLDREPTAVTDL